MKVKLLFVAAMALVAQPAMADQCTDAVNAAFTKLRKSDAFRMETRITNAQGELGVQTDYVPPDRMHQRVDSGTAAGVVELIVIGKRAWSNQGKQGWAELPEKFASTVVAQMHQTIADRKDDGMTYSCLGEQELEGKRYEAYQAKLPAAPGADTSNIQTVYIDKVTKVPARNIVTPAAATAKRLFDGRFTLLANRQIEQPVQDTR